MKKLYSALCLIALTVLIVFGQSSGQNPHVTLAWTPSTSPGIVGYYAYYGTNSQIYTQKQYTTNSNTITLTNLIYGYGVTYYFAATATDGSIESDFSNEVFWYATNGVSPPVLSISGESPN